MERNIEISRQLGFIDIEEKHFIEPHEVNRYPDKELLIITTGSQGEEMAALSRMATDEHRHIKLKPTDTGIISAHAIPGNEASVSSMMNKLIKAGVTGRYKDFDDIPCIKGTASPKRSQKAGFGEPWQTQKNFWPSHGGG